MHKKRQKPKNLKAALSNLFSYCKKEAGIILFALIMAALGAVLTIAGPNQISKITDYIYNGLTGEAKKPNLRGIFGQKKTKESGLLKKDWTKSSIYEKIM